MWCTTALCSTSGSNRTPKRTPRTAPTESASSSSRTLKAYLAYVVPLLGTSYAGKRSSTVTFAVPLARANPSHESATWASSAAVCTPGCVMPVSNWGTNPGSHTHSGSPSSWPFVLPSPSESIVQSARDHLCPLAAKSEPNALRAPPPAARVWPMPGPPGTLSAFGSSARYDRCALARATRRARSAADSRMQGGRAQRARVCWKTKFPASGGLRPALNFLLGRKYPAHSSVLL